MAGGNELTFEWRTEADDKGEGVGNDTIDQEQSTGRLDGQAPEAEPARAPHDDESVQTLGVPLDTEAPEGLARLGLTKGDPVRWRRKAGGRWQQGAAIGIETDGSIAVSDSQGRWRSLVVDQLEVKGEGPRGAARWEPLSGRVGQPDQLGMFH